MEYNYKSIKIDTCYIIIKEDSFLKIGDIIININDKFYLISKHELRLDYGYIFHKFWNNVEIDKRLISNDNSILIDIKHLNKYYLFNDSDIKIYPDLDELRTKSIVIKDIDKNWIWFETFCSCGDNDHKVSMQLSYDKELLETTIYTNCEIGDYEVCNYNNTYFLNLYKKIKWRIINSLKLLFHGYIKTESYIVLNGEEQALELSNVIKTSTELILSSNRLK